jgi:putative ABC transport system ATP-binding protein
VTYIRIKNLEKTYKSGENDVHALRGVDLEIKKGDSVVVLGASGSGKSTLLHMIGGMDNPTNGSILIGNKQIANMTDRELSQFRREQIGFIFQSYNLVPILTVRDNILLPIKLCKRKADNAYIDKVIAILGISDRLSHYPNQLSGGQQQRVAIARALSNKPSIILADEPTGNLDSESSSRVMDLLHKCNKEFLQTMLVITHDEMIARQMQRILRMKDGTLWEE